MEITKNSFKKILLLQISLVFIVILIELTVPFFTNYDFLDDKLHKGYLLNFPYYDILNFMILISSLLYFISYALLYFLKPIGRILNLVTLISVYIFSMLNGDEIYYGLTTAINDFTVFLSYFILYLIYMTPFKKEFKK